MTQKNNNDAIWQPSAKLEHLKNRAKLLQSMRDFFAARGILEVDTPLLCATSVTDPFIQSIPALFQAHPNSEEIRHYLQTSPEYAMKRLLASGSGPIYQICKAFRQGEIGRYHNPEFTMLEWYRPGFDHHQLMDEMDDLLQFILNTPPATRLSYQALFETYLHVNPHAVDANTLAELATAHHIVLQNAVLDKDGWLDVLLTHCIEPVFAEMNPVFIYNFPASQAALARLIPGSPPVAARFEVYYKGMELANGFHELQDAAEQRKRFEKNVAARSAQHLNAIPIDEHLLAALTHGLPDCAGVALGIDRLIMLALGCHTIQDVLSFDFSRA